MAFHRSQITFQSGRVNEFEGASAVSFDALPVQTVEEMMGGQGAATMLTCYDEVALVTTQFRYVGHSYKVVQFLCDFVFSLYFLLGGSIRWQCSLGLNPFPATAGKTLKSSRGKDIQQIS